MPRFRNGGAGTPAIMSEPAPPAAPVADPAGTKGARAVPLPDKSPATDPVSVAKVVEAAEKRKPSRAKKAAASPPKDA